MAALDTLTAEPYRTNAFSLTLQTDIISFISILIFSCLMESNNCIFAVSHISMDIYVIAYVYGDMSAQMYQAQNGLMPAESRAGWRRA